MYREYYNIMTVNTEITTNSTQFVSRVQAANMLGVSISTVYKWVRLGRLTAFKAGPYPKSPLKFRLSDIQAIQAIQALPVEYEPS